MDEGHFEPTEGHCKLLKRRHFGKPPPATIGSFPLENQAVKVALESEGHFDVLGPFSRLGGGFGHKKGPPGEFPGDSLR